jgi:hypothetical protein
VGDFRCVLTPGHSTGVSVRQAAHSGEQATLLDKAPTLYSGYQSRAQLILSLWFPSVCQSLTMATVPSPLSVSPSRWPQCLKHFDLRFTVYPFLKPTPRDKRKVILVCYVSQYSAADNYRRFGVACCLHLNQHTVYSSYF